ncbi:MAG: glutaminyl-peptide cyclotransferase, partial [Saprospiraceae bacterium]
LEYVNGIIYANIYTTNQIVKIEANTGKVLGVLDMANLKNENQDGEVLNGIAYNIKTGTFLITGKYWKKMYEVKI